MSTSLFVTHREIVLGVINQMSHLTGGGKRDAHRPSPTLALFVPDLSGKVSRSLASHQKEE
jgi:hypothetical protein